MLLLDKHSDLNGTILCMAVQRASGEKSRYCVTHYSAGDIPYDRDHVVDNECDMFIMSSTIYSHIGI